MKAFIIALLFIAGTAITQQVRGIEVCFGDFHQGIELVKKLKTDFQSKNILAVLHDIGSAQKILTVAKADCKDIQVPEIADYVYKHMTQAQKNCLTEVLSVFFIAQEVLEDAKAKNWKKMIEELKETEQHVNNGFAICKAAFARN